MLTFLFLALLQAPEPAEPQAQPPKPTATAAASDDTLKKELEALKGTWKFTKLEAGGQPPVSGLMDKFLFLITPETLTMRLGAPQYDETTKYKIDPKANPKTIDIIAHKKEADGRSKEQVAPGIYEIKGDVLRICFVKEGVRPKEFASKAGDPAVLMELKRAPDAK